MYKLATTCFVVSTLAAFGCGDSGEGTPSSASAEDSGTGTATDSAGDSADATASATATMSGDDTSAGTGGGTGASTTATTTDDGTASGGTTGGDGGTVSGGGTSATTTGTAGTTGSASGTTGSASGTTGGPTTSGTTGSASGTTGGSTTSGGTTGGGTTGGGTTGGGTTGGGTTSGGGTTGGTTGVLLDPCKKVDVVMSIDNSNSMQEEIAALTAQSVFQNMIDRLQNDVGMGGVDDFNLGVIDACPKTARYHNWGAGGNCSFPGGLNYLISTKAAPLDPTMELACVTNFVEAIDNGYNGMSDSCIDTGVWRDDNEQPAFTAAASLTEAANSGFLRTEAVLFIIAITDEDEEMIGLNDNTQPRMMPQDVVDMITAQKGGNINSVVFLGIGGGAGGCTNGAYGSAQDAVNLRGITNIFAGANRGLYWDLCGGNLADAIDQALDIVDSACITPS